MLDGWEIRKAWSEALKIAEEITEKEKPQSEKTEASSSPAAGNVRRPEMRVRHPHRGTRLPTQVELNNMYGHIATVMGEVGYSDAEKLKFMTYLRQLHMRAGIVNWETHIYHIFCRKILRRLGVPRFDGLDDSLED